jgi:hypothetical protein
MAFILTIEHVRSFIDPASHGDWTPFLNAIDPEVDWFINDPAYTQFAALEYTYVQYISGPGDLCLI